MSAVAAALATDRIRDLGVIGNRRTVALLDRAGTVVWYCPGRIDQPSLFAALLDEPAGSWRVQLPGGEPLRRGYLEDSGVLETTLQAQGKAWAIIVRRWRTCGAIHCAAGAV